MSILHWVTFDLWKVLAIVLKDLKTAELKPTLQFPLTGQGRCHFFHLNFKSMEKRIQQAKMV